MKELVFYYDVVCPFAYVASTLVEKLAARCCVKLVWKPVLLAGLYSGTSAPQGKAGSATDVMSDAKRSIVMNDLELVARRNGVPALMPSSHPQKTLYAMRLLASCPDMYTRSRITHSLYKAYWCDGEELTNLQLLQQLTNKHEWEVDVSNLVQSSEASDLLRSNTDDALKHGAFGVPGFWVGDRLFWGVDRMFLVERYFGDMTAAPLQLTTPRPGTGKLTYYLDYASPWSYLAAMQLDTFIRSMQPMNITVEYVPILLGALFKEIGTAMVPLMAMPEVKRQYMAQDMRDWADYHNVKLQWPSTFPIRTVQPLRVTIAGNNEPKLIRHLYEAAWRDNKNIGDENVLREVLQHGGFDVNHLIKKANAPSVKEQLKENTKRAVDTGLCGVPSFQVNDGGVVLWGQDRLNVVADMLCNSDSQPSSKL
ncbi:uncharacterized protein [Dysidea avara]|uniref:uncharacterized protein n=1 Tax=Dysidea avara TaxID=196820 RepID=UPI0033336045